jgi:RES domain-containing protein
LWRILSPRWAHAPLNGDGAARHGGRWNRPGQPALYLSETIETAFAEYQQEMGVRPGTFVAYDLSDASIIDLTDPATQTQLGLRAADLLEPWKEAAFVRKVDPGTWRIAGQLVGGFDGLRAPSAQYPGGVNIVLWRWNADQGARISYFDPRAELIGGPTSISSARPREGGEPAPHSPTPAAPGSPPSRG